MSFWAEAAKEIDWIKPPNTVFDPQAGVYGRWFPDGTLNTCYNALDRHVINGRADSFMAETSIVPVTARPSGVVLK